MTEQAKETAFTTTFRGSFSGMLRWEDLDALWQTVRGNAAGWDGDAIGEAPPTPPPTTPGVSCGLTHTPPLPGWVLSRLPPVALYDRAHRPENRKRWWRRLWE